MRETQLLPLSHDEQTWHGLKLSGKFCHQFVGHEGGFLQHTGTFLAFHDVLWSLTNAPNFTRFARTEFQKACTCTFASLLLNLPVDLVPA